MVNHQVELLRGHQEEVRIDLLEVNSIHDRLDSGGTVIRVPLTGHFLGMCHLVNTFLMLPCSMLTVEEEGDQMVALRLAHDRLRDGVRSHDASRN